jgi:hypothetical protein
MSSRPSSTRPRRAPTELAIGHDGTIYVNAEGVDAAKLVGRKLFVGHALRRDEIREALKVPLERLTGHVLASDGRTYASRENAGEASGRRKVFRGFAMTEEEAKIAVREVQRIAFNVTIQVQTEMKGRRKKRAAT